MTNLEKASHAAFEALKFLNEEWDNGKKTVALDELQYKSKQLALEIHSLTRGGVETSMVRPSTVIPQPSLVEPTPPSTEKP